MLKTIHSFLPLFIFFILATQPSYSQIKDTTHRIHGVFESIEKPDYYEIHEIRLLGTDSFSVEEIMSFIQTKASSRSLINTSVLNMYKSMYFNKDFRKVIPEQLFSSMRYLLILDSNDVGFFDQNKLNNDLENIRFFYLQNGFHKAEVDWEFFGDSTQGKNILEIRITENPRSIIKDKIYLGLDSLPQELKVEIKKLENIKAGMFYNEASVANEAAQIHRFLLDNGYCFASYDGPVNLSNDETNQDSIVTLFHTGSRKRISQIDFVDSLRGQKIVARNMKERQLEFTVGDWYSRSKVDKSISNLFNVGTFDIALIAPSEVQDSCDTTLRLTVHTQYRTQQEYGVSPFLNQTSFDKTVNFGIEASYLHRNIFGAAQAFNPYVRVLLIDINNAFDNSENRKKIEYEFQIGINFAQPLLYTIDEARVGLSFQALFAQRTIYETLKINTIGLPIKFPITLPMWTYFNMMNIDFSFERQSPINYLIALNDAHQSDVTVEDSLKTEESFRIYGNLDSYVKKNSPWLTTSTFGISIIGDTRNNPFSPKKGYFAAISIDGFNWLLAVIDPLLNAAGLHNKITGIAKFYRLQATNYWYWQMSQNLVFALKQREGFIIWWDKLNSYIPFERQFFAGGANSVRAWPSRQLRYGYDYNASLGDVYDNFRSNYIGSGALIEGSMEFRYRFESLYSEGNTFKMLLSNFGITAFIDWGNTFNWLIVDENGEYIKKNNLVEYITKLAVGAGFGFRYETPVGPVRFDFAWPIYDPARNKDQTIFTRNNVWGLTHFNVALGHAF